MNTGLDMFTLITAGGLKNFIFSFHILKLQTIRCSVLQNHCNRICRLKLH